MNSNFHPLNTTEKTLEENPLLVLLESKVIFKINNVTKDVFLSQISNIRIVKNRDSTANILLLLLIALFYLLSKSILANLNFVFEYLCLFVISILLIVTFFIKNFTYKLLINSGQSGFNEIPVSKNNIFYAKNFVSTFEKTNISKGNIKESKFKFKDFKRLC